MRGWQEFTKPWQEFHAFFSAIWVIAWANENKLNVLVAAPPSCGDAAAGYDFGDAARMAAEFAPILGGAPAGQRRH